MYSKSPSAAPLSAYNQLATRYQPSFDEDEPDMSHLSLEEQEIIRAVMERQKAEEKISPIVESKYNTLPLSSKRSAITSHSTHHDSKSTLNSCHSISDLSAEHKQRYGSVDTGNVCQICNKTKFTNPSSGHTCFACQRRCCVKCAYRYTTKTRQFWSCAECKHRQDALLKSGKWLVNSHLTSRKYYASDYILSRAAEVGVGLDVSDDQPTQELTSLVNSIHSKFNKSSRKPRKLPVPGGRQLPVPVEKGPHSNIKYNTYIQTSNSAQSVPELARDDESFNNVSSPNNGSAIAFNNTENKQSIPAINMTRVRQPLIKQASLNNPPTYRQAHLDTEEALYETTSKTRTFTSNQDLLLGPNGFTSSVTTSSISSNRQRERLQDPLKVLSTIRNPSSNMSSLGDLYNNKISMQEDHYSSKQQPLKTLLHTDSLSSDPSDYQSMPNYPSDSQIDTDTKNRKRTSRPRRQPSIPDNANLLSLKQQLQQKVLHKQNVLKQHSLTSSDENLNNDDLEKHLNETNSTENLNQLDEEEFVDEIRSTTEYTTNDEMDLESGSVSLPQAGRSLPCPRKILPTIQSRFIDDYLVQDLRKEELLAAKMSKFLSPCSWTVSKNERMCGHLVLKRQGEDSQDLGLKVLGGKMNPVDLVLSAYVVQVRKDSIAESVGRLQVGDEVLEWNGQGLRGLAYDEVHAIMTQTRRDIQVEIKAERLMSESERRQLKNLIGELSIVPDNSSLFTAPLVAFNSNQDISVLKSCPTKPSTRMCSSLYTVRESIGKEIIKSRSFLDKGGPGKKVCLKNTPLFFKFNTDSIDKSLIAKPRLYEVNLLSIALDSPIHAFQSKRQVQETPILITRINKAQLRQNRIIRRNASLCDESQSSSSSSSNSDVTPLTKKNSVDQIVTLNTIDFEVPETKQQIGRNMKRNLGFDQDEPLPCAPPSCIESLGLVIKLIKEKLKFNKPVKEQEIHFTELKRQRYMY